MSDFYSEWLERSKNNEKVVNDAPRVIRSKDLKWVRTRQDHKAALMIAPRAGVSDGWELPHAGGNPGRLAHRQASAWRGSDLRRERRGFMVLDEKRYDFFPGTVLHIPYRSKHQLFNTGKVPSAICRAWPGIWRPMFTWGKWNSLKIAARTTRRFYLISRRKSRNIGRRTGGGSRCIRNSTRNPTSRTWGNLFSDGSKRQAERLQGYRSRDQLHLRRLGAHQEPQPCSSGSLSVCAGR